jgi:hypothetical protein
MRLAPQARVFVLLVHGRDGDASPKHERRNPGPSILVQRFQVAGHASAHAPPRVTLHVLAARPPSRFSSTTTGRWRPASSPSANRKCQRPSVSFWTCELAPAPDPVALSLSCGALARRFQPVISTQSMSPTDHAHAAAKTVSNTTITATQPLALGQVHSPFAASAASDGHSPCRWRWSS